MPAHVIITTDRLTPDTPRRALWNLPVVIFTVALLLGVAARVQFGRAMPLWFDETFTATIATQPTAAALLRWCLTELTGPGFYGPMWLWVRAFGASDLALRTPSLILSIAAPIVIAIWGHPDRNIRLMWASVGLLWLPAFPFANDARPYPQLFFLGCVQAIVFARMIREPTTRTALAWTSVTALLILTHYSALPMGACQGLAYLIFHRRRAVDTWPALAAFLPAGLWMAWHLSFVTGMTMGPGSNTGSMALSELVTIPALIFGIQSIGLLVIGIMITTAMLPRLRAQGARLSSSSDVVLALTGLIALASVIAFATVHLGFTPRYLTPVMPSVLFGVAMWARWSMRADGRPVLAVFLVLASAVASLLYVSGTTKEVDARHLFSFETATAWLAERRPERLIFLWTDGMGDVSGDENVADVAGFSFRRRGHPVAVTIVHRRLGQDTSALARAAAGTDPRTAILWIANDRERRDPTIPRIAEQDPRWTCRDFGRTALTVTACRR